MIDKVLSSVIALKNIDHFSAIEIRTAYIAIRKDEQLDPSAVRRFVYAQLLKLVAKGWLKKRTSNKKGVTRYIKTHLFNHSYFLKLAHTKQIVLVSESDDVSHQHEFTVRLNRYNAQLLEGLGAMKEYVALKDIYPALRSTLKQKYLTAQENNQILKGKIDVLKELLISQQDNLQ